MARVYLKGLPQLKAKLEKLRRDTAPEVRPVLGEAAQKIVDMMRRLAPVGSGNLRDSIGWRYGPKTDKGTTKVASVQVGQTTVTIFASVFYARWVEFGTPPHIVGGKFAGAQHPGSKAHPFFFVSFRALRKEVKRMLAKAIREAIKKAVR